MKCIKILSILTIAALILVPTTAMAKTKFSISLNLIEGMRPLIAPPAPVVPVVIAPTPAPVYYYIPCPPPVRVQHRTIVKEYHIYHQAPEEEAEEINPSAPCYHVYPRR